VCCTCVAVYCIYEAVCCSDSFVLQCVAVCCSVLQCVAVRCSGLQCVAVCCSVLHLRIRVRVRSTVRSAKMCFSVLQCVVLVSCGALQCVSVTHSCCSMWNCEGAVHNVLC